jgi:hypothetical protein
MAALIGPGADCVVLEVGERATLKRIQSSSNLAPAGISRELSMAFVIWITINGRKLQNEFFLSF